MKLFLLLFAITTIDIKQEDRVANEQPGYCCWACLETLGRHNGIKPLYGLLESRKKDSGQYKHIGYDSSVREKLTRLRVKHRIAYNSTLLNLANSDGCVVNVKQGALTPNYEHSIVLIHYDARIVRFYDPNKPKDTWRGSRKWFDYWFAGRVIILEKEEHAPNH